MIGKDEIIQLHEKLNQQFWGAAGLRDMASLESALARPHASFAASALYNSPLEKIAALTESLVINHPFLEGNMRTAYVLMRILLMENGLDLTASQQARQTFMLDVATGKMRYEQMLAWLQHHTRSLSGSDKEPLS